MRPRTALIALIVALSASPDPVDGQEVGFDASLFLYHNRPVGRDAPPPRTEVYAAILSADVTAPRWRLYAQLRARDQLLRDFYPGTVWLQQAWAGWDVVAAASDEPSTLSLRAGKFDHAMGLAWDGSFSGNIQYFDALKRNPSFGLEASGMRDMAGLAVSYTLQYMLDSDAVSGAIPGRDFATMAGFRERDGVFGRVTLGLPRSLPVTATFGVSAATRGVAVRSGADEEVHHVPYAGLDAQVRRGAVTAYVEWLRRSYGGLPNELQNSIPGSAATYWLAGAQFQQGPLSLRYNHSRGRYSAIDRDDWIHQPGVGYDLNSHMQGIAELNVWRFRDPDGEGDFARSLNIVLRLGF